MENIAKKRIIRDTVYYNEQQEKDLVSQDARKFKMTRHKYLKVLIKFRQCVNEKLEKGEIQVV